MRSEAHIAKQFIKVRPRKPEHSRRIISVAVGSLKSIQYRFAARFVKTQFHGADWFGFRCFQSEAHQQFRNPVFV